MSKDGKKRCLAALNGQFSSQIPVGLFTWEFDYNWKPANLAPWQLYAGSSEMWHQTYLALWQRHQPDMIWYSGAGYGDREPLLLKEDDRQWYFKDNNTGRIYVMMKDSFTVLDAQTLRKSCDPIGPIESKEDAKRLIPEFSGWGEVYLNGLKRLINEFSNRVLVLPHHSPGYICGCYALGFEKSMEMMISQPELFRYVCDRYAAGDTLRMQQLAEAGAQAVFIADGWASCDVLSPAMIKEFAIPYQKSIIDAAHKAGLKVILWNEGDIIPILDLEAALEMDAFAFEQPRKKVNLNVGYVRKVFGPCRCLLGNLDSEHLLLRNNPSEITEQVHQIIRDSGKGNPFIMCTGSPIPNDVSLEAVDTMIQAVRNFMWDE